MQRLQLMCDAVQCRGGLTSARRKLLEEIEREVTHLEPYTINGPLRCPSTAWCLMFKACMMRRTLPLLQTVPSAVQRK